MNRLSAILLLVLTLLVSGYACADTRVALVIGNSQYASVDALLNPRKDAALVAATLKREGFTVTLVQDATRTTMLDALNAFNDEADRADWALVYYAGHGMEVEGTNFLLPTDARLRTDRDVQDEAVSLPRVLETVANARKLRLVILDACRNNLFASPMRREFAERSVSRGLARPEPQAGIVVVYAAEAGAVADDGAGDHSPFTAALVKRLEQPGLEVSRLFNAVTGDVLRATDQRQRPYEYGSNPSDEEFYFTPPAPVAPPPSREEQIWSFLKATKDVVGLTAFRDGLPSASPLRLEVEAYISSLGQVPSKIGSPSDEVTLRQPDEAATVRPSSNERQPTPVEMQEQIDVMEQDLRERAFFNRVLKAIRADQDRTRERANAELLKPPQPILAQPLTQSSLEEQRVQAEFEAAARAEAAARDAAGASVQAAVGQEDGVTTNLAITVAHRAALLVDAPDEPQKIKTFSGSVVWHLDRVSPGQGLPLIPAVKADIDIPDAKLKVTMVMQRNLEPQLSASHTIEIHFFPQPGCTLGDITQINVPDLRKDDAPAGDALAGVPVMIDADNFLVGLSRGGAEAQNKRLISERNWFDISVLLAQKRPGKLIFEKGLDGQQLWDQAFAAWGPAAATPAAVAVSTEPASSATPGKVTTTGVVASAPNPPPKPDAQPAAPAITLAPNPFPEPKRVETWKIHPDGIAIVLPSDKPPPPQSTVVPLSAQPSTPVVAAVLPSSSPAISAKTSFRGDGSYKDLVFGRFAQHALELGERARHQHLKGQVIVAFGVDDSGGIAQIRVMRSSGNSALDAIGVDLVRASAPFPPPPPNAPRNFTPAFGFGQ